MILEWLEEAKLELLEAARYYEWKDRGLGESLIDQVNLAVRKLMQEPLFPREFDPPYRKVVTERFPYQMIYVIKGETVFIVSLMHQGRRPGYWKNRR